MSPEIASLAESSMRQSVYTLSYKSNGTADRTIQLELEAAWKWIDSR